MVAMKTPGRPPLSTEIITVASGKGGTGKTSIITALGYALQKSGLRVLLIDADTATDGLSLYLLGNVGLSLSARLASANTFSGYLRAFEVNSNLLDWIAPLEVNRGAEADHGLIYHVLISGRSIYGDGDEELNQPATPQLSRDTFREAVKALFVGLRAGGQWDYVLVDTRGGFGFNTTDVCALSDSFIVVTEADPTSFYQDKNLMRRISRSAEELGAKPRLRGIIVNKATEFQSPSSSGVFGLDLDKVEQGFRNAIAEEFHISYLDTYPVPLDIAAVLSYKSQASPYVASPESVFSYATLSAFSNLMAARAGGWPGEIVKNWNGLVDRVSQAIQTDNERRRLEISERESLAVAKSDLERENQQLQKHTFELQRQFEASSEYEKVRLERDREQRRSQLYLTAVAASLFVAVTVGLMYYLYVERRNAEIEVEAATRQRLAQEQQIATLNQKLEKSTVEFSAASSVDTIQTWLFPYNHIGSDGTLLDPSGKPAAADKEHVAVLKTWLSKRGFDGVPIATFLNSTYFASARTQFVEDSRITVKPPSTAPLLQSPSPVP